MLIGSVSEEGNRMSSRPSEAEWHATLARTMGDEKATALIVAMKKAHPEKSIRTLSYGVSGLMVRNNVHAYGQDEMRTESSTRFRVLLHMAIADARRRGRLAHGRARFLLR